MTKLFISILLFLQANSSAFASDNGLLALEQKNSFLLNQKASGCRTECTYSEAFRRTTCQEVCDQPVVGMCERSSGNVFMLGCLTGGVIGGLLGFGMGSGMTSAMTYGLGGCAVLGGGAYLLKASSNCP